MNHFAVIVIVWLPQIAYTNLVHALREVFLDLTKRTWGSRMWTIQEIATASSATVLSGHTSYDFDLLSADLEFVNQILPPQSMASGVSIQLLECSPLADHIRIRNLYEFYRMRRAKHPLPEIVQVTAAQDLQNSGYHPLHRLQDHNQTYIECQLLHVLNLSRQSISSDPRDRVFALISLLAELNIQLPPPDYEKTTEEVYYSATLALAKDSHSTAFLCLSGGILGVLSGLSLQQFWFIYCFPDGDVPAYFCTFHRPSWVLDFSSVLPQHIHYEFERHQAAGTSCSVYEFDDLTMRTAGMICDEITYVLPG